ncbi:beta-galactosidase precursor [Zea mays]|uniref:Beta-galactosidase n=2 Tax=Zea mays TaxID=4577 RepID=B8A0V4_MAIZE|nr:beta-galactosidase precursor [Zea mays]ACL53803.1 unknown [Zea mays]ONL96134.1 Beta-galactosidase [Zea mays]|eukprot:NP_001146370.1 beta-galactosidase precursor [Zea mays]
MAGTARILPAAAAALLLLLCIAGGARAANVTYDHRALVIDGVRRVLVSGSIHYPRSTPDMWPGLIQKAKDGGLDVIETYVFWDIHEPVRGQYDFEGRKDLAAFVKTVADAGLYVHLRIGPYVCAEWNYGGFPLWLHFIPGIKFRTDNEPFKAEMQRFTAKVVDTMKGAGLYASQGGPIILSQIENEYGNIDSAYGAPGKAYMRWAAGMAVSLDTGVPWVMCQQADAPDPLINTCNGFYCDQFTPNSAAKPKMWTENWSGWFLSFGGAVPYRPVEDLAFAVARFYQRGGTFQNYYMYHGGTNLDRSSGGPFIATSYDYDAPIDEYGLVRQPKWGHLRDVHKAIKLCEPALIATDPSYTSLGPNVEAAVYKVGSVCAAFLANIDGQSDKTVTFNGKMYRLPAWSVSILPDCKNVVLNTAQINSQTTGSEMRYLESSNVASDGSFVTPELAVSDWSYAIEPVGITKDNALTKAGLMEQINTTADASDFLWYSTSITVKGDEPYLNGSQSNLAVNSLGHVLQVYINGKIAGSAQGSASSSLISWQKPIELVPGKNKIDLLSATVGLSNYGAFFDLVGAGITGPVKLSGLNGALDLSSAEWTYQIGLRGEDLHLYDPSEASPEWVSANAYPINHPLIWYKTKFTPPAGDDPVAIDFTGMGKGEAWVNGQSIGRYWPTNLAPQSGCVNSCNYRGAYSSSKCLKKCGQPSQTLYHVPRSFLQPGSNDLVLFEHFGGDPSKISFVMRQTGSVCAQVSEAHPAQIDSWSSQQPMQRYGPALRLECPKEGQVISSVKFASFGTPSGTCGSYSHGECSSTQALSIVQEACIGVSSCSVPVSSNYFGNPCTGVTKSLAVEAACS